MEGDSISGLPESRQEDFEELIELIGKWELALTVASTAVVSGQGKKQIVDHYVARSSEFIERAKEKTDGLVKSCTYCEEPFLIRRTNQKYCSKSCLNKARNERYREGNKSSS